ncbi:hypothetical protein Rsub_07655 [Raphidocelis subcapitata]|uniref:Uncharacterized protein n=1 Tax=Raphidocelis subcapitata TaxID=307507 RepID=A0A2V0P772_9CHLO|nr:hypothetical protein Rsub_07655 [Raphidocelis subcapitata]|eukprot:GBF94772.1 hypothetical protein Rsub_07655 [Raphidocelis subcapitata]
MDTRLDPTVTYHYDKLSCLRGAYFAHVFFCYIVFLTGVACMVTRVWPRARFTHAWFGRAYVHSMLWAMATSLIIHNTGLPIAVLISFVWVLGGLCIGWVLINVHQVLMARAASKAARARIEAAGGVPGGDLDALLAEERGRIAAAKTFKQRFFSLKAAHGALMVTSWTNIMGRIFASNQSGDFTCYTYPYYKQIDTPEFSGASLPLSPVPARNPEYARLPWAKLGNAGWGAALLLGPLAGAAVVGAIYAFFEARSAAAVAARSGAPAGAEARGGKPPAPRGPVALMASS